MHMDLDGYLFGFAPGRGDGEVEVSGLLLGIFVAEGCRDLYRKLDLFAWFQHRQRRRRVEYQGVGILLAPGDVVGGSDPVDIVLARVADGELERFRARLLDGEPGGGGGRDLADLF